MVGQHDLGGEDLVAVRVVGVLRAYRSLDVARPRAPSRSARRLVGVDREVAVRLAERGVAEGVVEVLVGVDDPGHRRRRRGGVRRRRPRAPRGRAVGVDHQQAAVAAHQRDVDVEPRRSARPRRGRRPRGTPVTVRSVMREPADPSRLGTRAPSARDAGTCDEEEARCWRNAGSPCSARSWRTTSPPRSRSAPRRSSSGTASASPRRRSATTWRRWRRRASSPSRTPAPAGCRPTRATGSSSTG